MCWDVCVGKTFQPVDMPLGGKYAVLTSGDLYIYNAGPSDGYKTYACRTVHRLTGEVHASAYPGRIIITGKKKVELFF